MRKSILSITLALMVATPFAAQGQVHKTYSNPVIKKSVADPTIIKEGDTYYLYSTGERVPVYTSKNLVDWTFVCNAFTDQESPRLIEHHSGIWAPGVYKINGKFVMYYSQSVGGLHGGKWDSVVGVAVADSPAGPWKNLGLLIDGQETGVANSIDPCFISDHGHNYLCWGSFYGLFIIELTADGTKILPGAKAVQVAGDGYEGSYLMKRGRYFYLFASSGRCCRALSSTYAVEVGRSKNIFGPYLDRSGDSMMDNKSLVVLSGNHDFVGPGHNSKIVKDDAGHDWMFYHSYLYDEPQLQRVACMDRVRWIAGWPVIKGGHPSSEAKAPKFRK